MARNEEHVGVYMYIQGVEKIHHSTVKFSSIRQNQIYYWIGNLVVYLHGTNDAFSNNNAIVIMHKS